MRRCPALCEDLEEECSQKENKHKERKDYRGKGPEIKDKLYSFGRALIVEVDYLHFNLNGMKNPLEEFKNKEWHDLSIKILQTVMREWMVGDLSIYT